MSNYPVFPIPPDTVIHDPLAHGRSTAVAFPDQRFLNKVAEPQYGEAAPDQKPGLKASILICTLNEQKIIGHAVHGISAMEYICEEKLIVAVGESSGKTALVPRAGQFNRPAGFPVPRRLRLRTESATSSAPSQLDRANYA